MYAKAYSSCLVGLDGQVIEVECNVHAGLPSFILIGLPSSSVRESAERVRTGIQNSGFDYPMRRITVNLAPSELRKDSSSLDLAMAVCLLTCTNQIQFHALEHTLFIGEVALDGSIRAVAGVLSMVENARRRGFTQVVVPQANLHEARLIKDIRLFPIQTLLDLKVGLVEWQCNDAEVCDVYRLEEVGDFAACIGQTQAIRAITIAVTGHHHLMFVGPPGAGKTMMMRLIPSIMPTLRVEEAIEVTKIYSITEHYPGGLIRSRPFRAPHHTISTAGLVGGGSIIKPGEITMAHLGVLFLDEFSEFPKSVLETLRQPLEQKAIHLSRAKQTLHFPANVLLTAATNPCPCGYYGVQHESKRCSCTASMISHHRGKISGPMLDRIDLVVEVPEVDLSQFQQLRPSPSSTMLREQIESALAFRARRGENPLDGAVDLFIQQAFRELRISMRARESLIRIARTIADLDHSEKVTVAHLSEAISYKNTILHRAVD
jgi:magnesium chelatase family protein